MFPVSSSAEADTSALAAAESPVAPSEALIRLTESISTERGSMRPGSVPLTRFSSRTRKSWISK